MDDKDEIMRGKQAINQEGVRIDESEPPSRSARE